MHIYLDCNANFTADPDIGGVGVMASFLAVAWFTVVIAIFSATYDMLHLNPENSSEHESELNPMPIWIRTAKSLLGPLCDLQAITGMAIVIAGFSQMTSISFYHESLITSYWWLTLNSFWVSRVEYMDPKTAKSDVVTMKVFARRLAIFTSCGLGIGFQIWVQLRESTKNSKLYEWDDSSHGKCYRYIDNTTPWPWIGGTFLYTLALFLVMVPSSRPWVATYLNKTRDFLQARKEQLKTRWDDITTSHPADASATQIRRWRNHSIRFSLVASTFLTWALPWVIVQAFAIWAYGEGSTPLVLFVYVIFSGWTTFDIITLKALNRHLAVDGDELKVGFGQVLPLVLVVQIGLSVIDLWEDAKREKEEEERKAKGTELSTMSHATIAI